LLEDVESRGVAATVGLARALLGWLFERGKPRERARVIASQDGAGRRNGTAPVRADETRRDGVDRSGRRYELPFDFF
jgi:hypothetical protein